MLFRTTYYLCIIVKVKVLSTQCDLYNHSILLLQFDFIFPLLDLTHPSHILIFSDL
jgi:hypothetical protein